MDLSNFKSYPGNWFSTTADGALLDLRNEKTTEVFKMKFELP